MGIKGLLLNSIVGLCLRCESSFRSAIGDEYALFFSRFQIESLESRLGKLKKKKKKKIAERIVKLVETSVRKIISGRPGTSCIHRYNCALLTYEKKRGKGTVIDRDTA